MKFKVLGRTLAFSCVHDGTMYLVFLRTFPHFSYLASSLPSHHKSVLSSADLLRRADMMILRVALAISFVSSLASSEEFDPCPDVCLEVFQENNFIGEFQPISTDYSIKTLYGYNSDNYSFNGDGVVPLVPNTSILFIHEDSRTNRCDLSLVIVHDSKEECSGGEVRMFITGDLEDSVVQDGRDSPSDTYIYNEVTGETECFWEWNWQSNNECRTDGIAHFWPSDKDCISVSAEFIRGIDDWKFVPGPIGNDGSVDPSDYIYLTQSRTLEICRSEC
jgi:hypothetical protein